jgi:hypothetical protein
MIYTNLRNVSITAALLFSLEAQAALSEGQKESYDQAKKDFIAKEYSKAYAILSTIYFDALDDPKLNYYLGRSAYESGEFPMALAAFERVEILDPNNVRNQFELARTQFYLRLFPEAQDGFQKILQNPGLSDNLRSNVEYYLGALAKEDQRGFWYSTAKLAYMYDSNVKFASSSDTSTFYIAGSPITLTNEKAMNDTAYETSVGLTHLYDFGAKGGAMLRNQFSIYDRHYDTLQTYDLRLFSYNPALVYNSQRSVYELIGGIDRLTLGDHSYYTSYWLQPKWTYSYLPSLRQTFAIKTGKKYYFQQSDIGLDSGNIDASGGVEYYPSPSSAIKADLLASLQRSTSNGRNDVDYKEYGPNLLYTNQIQPKTIIQVNGSLKKRIYDIHNDVFMSDRIDTTQSGTLTLIQRLNNAISLEVIGNYTSTHSTISIYSYDKYTLSMGVSARF